MRSEKEGLKKGSGEGKSFVGFRWLCGYVGEPVSFVWGPGGGGYKKKREEGRFILYFPQPSKRVSMCLNIVNHRTIVRVSISGPLFEIGFSLYIVILLVDNNTRNNIL